MPATYYFGPFRLDLAGRELRRGSEVLPLRRKAFDCLVHLVEHRDRVVGRDELIEAAWQATHLSDSVLAQAIVDVRRALGEHGGNPEFIKTVRGVGYRWMAPVETRPPASDQGKSRTHPWRWWWAPALPAIALLALLWSYQRPDAAADFTGEEEIALLLPLTIHAQDHHGWARYGAMELMAERLRAAGQPMVPSATVIALARELTDQPEPEDLAHVTGPTGATLVLAATAEEQDGRWRVALNSLLGPSPRPATVGEADDVLDAARLAADRMVLALGFAPVPEPDAEPGLQTLLQRIEATRLAHRPELGQALIDQAAPQLREHPEIRFQRARLDFYANHLEEARRVLESLLHEPAAARDPVFRARVVNGLGSIHASRGDRDAAVVLFEQAAALLNPREAPDIQGDIQMNLGTAAQESGQSEAARGYMAQARKLFEGMGDVQRLATLDLNRGAMEARQARYLDALRYLESAAEARAMLHDVGGELIARMRMLRAHLVQLDLEAALATQDRVEALLAQTTDPVAQTYARLLQVRVLDAVGNVQTARALLEEILTDVMTNRDARLDGSRLNALTLRAEYVIHDGDAGQAEHLIRQIAQRLNARNGGIRSDSEARSWLTLINLHLARGEVDKAAALLPDMSEQARLGGTVTAEVYSALIKAELAALQGRHDTARQSFEQALALVDNGQMPLHLLEVAGRYVEWLLYDGPGGIPDPDHALLVADRVADYVDRRYEAALLQLRVYHALGPASAWRAALNRTRALAVEREIPPELTISPEIAAFSRK